MITLSEQELRAQMAELEEDRKDVRSKLSEYRRAAIDAETTLIGMNIRFDNLKEQLQQVLGSR